MAPDRQLPEELSPAGFLPIPDPTARPGLSALLSAHNYARDADADLWDFAVEVTTLYETGMTASDMRWLVARDFAEHGNELSGHGDPHRSFEANPGFNFETCSCLVLTTGGATYVCRFLAASRGERATKDRLPADRNAVEADRDDDPPSGSPGQAKIILATVKPLWKTARRELYLGGVLVKRFRVPARNQELILEVFEEDNWPESIDDPLPPRHEICPKMRLRDTIHRLNNHQASPLLRFHGNGNGMGVYWETLAPCGIGAV